MMQGVRKTVLMLAAVAVIGAVGMWGVQPAPTGHFSAAAAGVANAAPLPVAPGSNGFADVAKADAGRR